MEADKNKKVSLVTFNDTRGVLNVDHFLLSKQQADTAYKAYTEEGKIIGWLQRTGTHNPDGLPASMEIDVREQLGMYNAVTRMTTGQHFKPPEYSTDATPDMAPVVVPAADASRLLAAVKKHGLYSQGAPVDIDDAAQLTYQKLDAAAQSAFQVDETGKALEHVGKTRSAEHGIPTAELFPRGFRGDGEGHQPARDRVMTFIVPTDTLVENFPFLKDVAAEFAAFRDGTRKLPTPRRSQTSYEGANSELAL